MPSPSRGCRWALGTPHRTALTLEDVVGDSGARTRVAVGRRRRVAPVPDWSCVLRVDVPEHSIAPDIPDAPARWALLQLVDLVGGGSRSDFEISGLAQLVELSTRPPATNDSGPPPGGRGPAVGGAVISRAGPAGDHPRRGGPPRTGDPS